MENTQTLPDYPKGLTFEQVWAALMENRAQQNENALAIKETDRIMKENARRQEERDKEREREMQEREKERKREMQERDKEREREMQERDKEREREMQEREKEREREMQERDRYIKEIGNRLGDFTNRFGDIVEHMIAPNLLEKFQEMGFEFEEASRKVKIRNKKNDIRFEIDVYLQNGDIAMLIEIKSDLTISDINKHIVRLEKMRKHADSRGDKRRFLGAVAGIVVEENEREYALKNGFFLIEPNGENFNITTPYNKPKEW